MFLPTYVSANVAEQHNRDLIAKADAYRLASTARKGRSQGRGQASAGRLAAHLAFFVNLFTRGGSRSLRQRQRGAALDG